MKMNAKAEFFKMMHVHNMECILRFHEHVEYSVAEFSEKIDGWEGGDEVDNLWWKREFEKHYPDKLRQSTFLLLISHFEEVLYLLSRSFNPDSIKENRHENGIKKYKPYIKHMLGGELGDCEEYNFIVDAYKVRNSLLHMSGRISISKNPENILSVIYKGSFYSKEKDRIIINPEGVYSLQKSISYLLDKIVNRLN